MEDIKSLNIEKQDTPDKELFDFLLDTDPEILKRFTPTVSEEEQERFLTSDFSINPKIEYLSLKDEDQELAQKKEKFLSKVPFLMQAYIDSRDLSSNEREEMFSYYRKLVERRTLTFDLISASQRHDYAEFDRLGKEIYGDPSIEIFNTYVKNLSQQLEVKRNDPVSASTVSEILEVLPVTEGEVLDEQTIPLEKFKNVLESQMIPIKNLLSEYSEDSLLGSSVVKRVFEAVLESLKIKDWNVEISSEYRLINVRGDERKVFVPVDREVSKNKLLGLVAHEIFTHVQRRKNSENILPYEILRTGLPGYLEAEEAVATFSEAVFDNEKKIDLGGGDIHFTECLALGLDGKKRDFKDVFKIVYLVKRFNNLQEGKDFAEGDKKAKDSAWKACLKVFRGTPGNIPGICFRKDIVYGEGRLKLIRYLQENKDSDISGLWKAKFSPWIEEHVSVIKKYE